jgi:hypothetical protein
LCDALMQLALKVDLQHEVFGLFENIHHQVRTTAPLASSFHRLILIPHHWARFSSAACVLDVYRWCRMPRRRASTTRECRYACHPQLQPSVHF